MDAAVRQDPEPEVAISVFPGFHRHCSPLQT